MTDAVADPGLAQDAVLRVDSLSVHLAPSRGGTALVTDVSFHVGPGELVSIVGESGSGKSLTGLAILGLAQQKGMLVGGSVRLGGRELLGLRSEDIRRTRGRELAMVFQDPSSALDPVFTIGDQLMEVLRRNQAGRRRDARAQAMRLLEQVGLARPDRLMRSHPHELSGGMSQRVGIAIAIAGRPKVLIADEPTSALDVTVQAQILDLFAEVRDTYGTAIVLVTHDMGVAALADRVVVLYAGAVVEAAGTAQLFGAPRHPYTAGLLASVPRLDGPPRRRLAAMPGAVPDPRQRTSGCPFAPRCPLAIAQCAHVPPMVDDEDHAAACWRSADAAAAGTAMWEQTQSCA